MYELKLTFFVNSKCAEAINIYFHYKLSQYKPLCQYPYDEIDSFRTSFTMALSVNSVCNCISTRHSCRLRCKKIKVLYNCIKKCLNSVYINITTCRIILIWSRSNFSTVVLFFICGILLELKLLFCMKKT